MPRHEHPGSSRFVDVSEIGQDRSFKALSIIFLAAGRNTSWSAPETIGAMASLYYPMGGAVSALTVVGLCMCVEDLCLRTS